MPASGHSLLVGEELHGPFRYEQSADPGAIGAGAYWLDTDTFALYRRNVTNDGWNAVGAGLNDPTTLQGDIIVRGASVLDRLGVGAINSLLYSDGVSPAWSAGPTVSGEITARDFKATGMTGATAGARFVGATSSGAPVTGTFVAGDFIVDLSVGRFYVCTVAGTPGTWVVAAGSMSNPMTTQYDLIIGGTSGTPTRLPVGSNGKVLTVVGGVLVWDNSPSGFANPMVNVGSLIIGDTGGSPVELEIGANDQVLTVVGGLPAWAAAGTSTAADASLTLWSMCV